MPAPSGSSWTRQRQPLPLLLLPLLPALLPQWVAGPLPHPSLGRASTAWCWMWWTQRSSLAEAATPCAPSSRPQVQLPACGQQLVHADPRSCAAEQSAGGNGQLTWQYNQPHANLTPAAASHTASHLQAGASSGCRSRPARASRRWSSGATAASCPRPTAWAATPRRCGGCLVKQLVLV